ncbi:MAG TPA: hypothetical protein VGP68_19230 [Gemmataceae bacterium]|jgi:hypothetical protein|nr:hypothetical protein [Gemmataceae bacterium]
MNERFLPSTNQIRQLLTQEITGAGGTVSDTFDDGQRLFMRSTFPQALEVQPGDFVQGGVALRAAEEEVFVHPYIFRQVCRNGAIAPRAIGSLEERRLVAPATAAEVAEVLADLADAVRSCCAEEVFRENVDNMASTSYVEANFILTLTPMLAQLPAEQAAQLLRQLLDRFGAARKASKFAIMNAVTATARDTKDPELRWRLEEFGGGIAAKLRPTPTPSDIGAVACGV